MFCWVMKWHIFGIMWIGVDKEHPKTAVLKPISLGLLPSARFRLLSKSLSDGVCMRKQLILTLLVQAFLLSAHGQTSEINKQLNKNTHTQSVVILDQPEVVEPFESSPSSPPLATDDPGTPGRHGVEINFVSDCDRSRNGKTCETIIDSNFGIGDKIQLKIEKAAVQETSGEGTSFHGVGPTEIGVKYRFYDKNGVALAVYPNYTMNDGSRKYDENGAAVESEGRSIYIPLIVSKKMGKYTAVANIGYKKALDQRDEDTITTAIALGRSFSETTRMMAEIHSERSSNFSNERTDVRIGWVKVIFPTKTGKYQTSLFTSVGRSVGATDDGLVHTTVQFGLSVVKK